MSKRFHAGAAIALACLLLLAACRDRHEPTKPTVAPAAATAPAHA